MSHTTTHILYEWLNEYQEYRSLIIHQLDKPEKFRIPEKVLTTPVFYGYYLERWYLSNGRELTLPYKVR